MTVLAYVVRPVGLCQLLTEPLDHWSSGLPNGIHTASSIVRSDKNCIQSGVVPVQVWNLSQKDIWVQPKNVLGSIYVVEIVESTNTTRDADVNAVTVQYATKVYERCVMLQRVTTIVVYKCSMMLQRLTTRVVYEWCVMLQSLTTKVVYEWCAMLQRVSTRVVYECCIMLQRVTTRAVYWVQCGVTEGDYKGGVLSVVCCYRG